MNRRRPGPNRILPAGRCNPCPHAAGRRNPSPPALAAAVFLSLVLLLLLPCSARAGFTDTVPKWALLVDEGLVFSWVDGAWGNDGRRVSLVEPLDLYEPGGPKQGTLAPDPYVKNTLLITQVYAGLLEDLTFGLGLPVVLETAIDSRLRWKPGEYQPRLGRAYTDADFWSWAAAMGQPRPADFRGNRGVPSDLVLGLRWRFSDRVPALRREGVRMSVMVSGVAPTGRAPDPEDPVALGTTLWDLNAQGDLAARVGIDHAFRSLDGRLTIGGEVFYEAFFSRTRRTPKGTRNPLLLTQAPYVGETYRVKPGDWSGFAFELSGVPWVGPPLATWLSGNDAGKAVAFPPLLTLAVGFRFQHVQQSDWSSDSTHWDWRRERQKKPGYRNLLTARATLSLLRLGVPLQVYLSYANSSWIPGRNAPAGDVLTLGLQVPLKFW